MPFRELASADPAASVTNTSQANNPIAIALGGERIIHAPPAAGDLDGDGDKEIVVGTYDGMLHVIAFNENSWSVVWSRQTAQDLNTVLPARDRQSTGRIDSAPSIGDVDKDGNLEIVVTLGGVPDGPVNSRNGGVIVYEHLSGWNFAAMPGWPLAMPDTMGTGERSSYPDGVRDGIITSAALGDVDGDGDLEIFTQSFDRRILGWHHNGTDIAGWPIERSNGDPLLRGGWSSPAIGDIDNDGLDEVVLGNNSPPWGGDGGSTPPDYTKATLWALNGDSTLVPGFPIATTQWIQSSPALGDIDGDGDLEIVVGTGTFLSGTGGYKVYAWHGNGSLVAGWPRPTQGNMPASPALADLDEDGILDVIIGCGGEIESNCTYLYAWRGDGSNLPGFPMQPRDANPWPGYQNPSTQPFAPVVADIDADGRLEILMAMPTSVGITVVEHDGSSNDYSRTQVGYEPLYASPLVADLDNDGLLETVAAGAMNQQAAVHIWQEVGEAKSGQAWPMFHRNMTRNGRYMHPRLIAPADSHLLHPANGNPTLQGQIDIKNSGDDAFQWRIVSAPNAVHFDETSGVIIDVVGLPFTVDARGHTQNKWHNLGDVTISGMIDGQPVLDSPQNVTVWLYVGDMSYAYIPSLMK